MRNRSSQSSNVLLGDNASEVTSSSSSVGGAPPPPTPQDRAPKIKSAALCDDYAVKLRHEAADLERRRPSFWSMRCSSSIFVGLLLWALIGLVVCYKINEHPPLSDSSKALITTESALPDYCRGNYCFEDNGTEPFGAVLGAHDGVYAYGNCYAQGCISLLDFEYPIPLPPGSHTLLDAPEATTRLMRTGMKWQCVEYARRYWMLRGKPAQAVFGSVEGAADMWSDLSFVTLLDNVSTAPLFKYANGAVVGYGGSAPRVGDLVIYPRDNEGKVPYGHVAVIVRVELPEEEDSQPQAALEGRVYLAEQNWYNNPWPEPYHNYSRWLPLRVTAPPQGTALQYTIHDDYHPIQGWMRYGDP
ncbi:putative D-alanyl-glycyl endopeptidase-like protein cysteine peptidase Clan CA family C51 [Leptomonas seymouri]|uniref:Putative D-alanyl-glycyl endopeptidase-like protein cysteine peptidase Clan CA family C51 n=1 Tax=Leptomonas seymouri TaxID=5684 RepID=A0A0N1PB04_LEPSE|nr:putative D-alanyl-glycyl endopeptidase-like protein cysteine peptidase Clan CA family C51 [Leptomonas seymouri]|eukprot:KPI83093.1 putative D-alanyl-glycyl endopeptidase-like protein cysteine peptidase Clan CA family C51 [Leptomonas seymouri]